MPACRPVSRLIARTSARTVECSSCVPCEKLSRKTLTPASINRRRTAGDRDAGPIVATILVRLGGSSSQVSAAMHSVPRCGSSGLVAQFVECLSDHAGAGPELGLLGFAQG